MKRKLIYYLITLFSIYSETGYTQNYIPHVFYGEDTILYFSPFDLVDSVTWGTYGVDITAGNGALDKYYGLPNTEAIVEQLGDNGGVPYPAMICDTLTAYGYNDWYLPSMWEIDNIAYKQDSIISLYRPSYIYWSSYETDSIFAYSMYFYYPEWMGSDIPKFGQCKCRCVRREYTTHTSETENLIKELKIIPDIAKNEINVRITGITGEYELSIYNIQGSRVKNSKIRLTGDGYSGKIDISGYAKGTYIVEVRNGKFVKTVNFIL